MIATLRAAVPKALAVCLALGLAAGLGGSGAAFADTASPSTTSASTFGVQPANAKGADPTRSAFSYSATPGARIDDRIAVTNFSTKPITLHLYGADAFNSADGGYAILDADQRSKDLGHWIVLRNGFLQMQARQTVVLPFSIDVPGNATPGDHAAGLLVGLNQITTDAKGNRVNRESRVGIRVAIRVSGKLNASVTVANIHSTYHGSWIPFASGSADIGYDVVNDGNVRLGVARAVKVTSLLGGSVKAGTLHDIAELLPGNKIHVSAHVAGVTPSLFSTTRVTVDPVGIAGDIDPKLSSIERTATMITIPWTTLLLILLVAFGGFWYWRRRRALSTPPKGLVSPAKKRAPAASGSR